MQYVYEISKKYSEFYLPHVPITKRLIAKGMPTGTSFTLIKLRFLQGNLGAAMQFSIFFCPRRMRKMISHEGQMLFIFSEYKVVTYSTVALVLQKYISFSFV